MSTVPHLTSDPAVPAWARAPLPALPTEPRSYPHGLRTPRARWWRGVLALVSLVAAFGLLSVIFGFGAVAIDIATGRSSVDGLASGQVTVTPMVFLANNLALAALIPVSMLLQWAFFGVRPRWLSSVAGGLRWRWMARAGMVVLPVFVLYVGLSYLLIPSSSDQLGRLSADAALMLGIVVLTTPFQAAGEEYGFRGLIARAAGSWFAGPTVALVVGGVLANLAFMAAHFATDPWLLAYYVVFGAALSVIAWRTGGLEVPILIHAANNVLLLVPVALFGDLSGAFERGPGTGGPVMLIPMAVVVLLVGVVEWWTRRNRVQRCTVPVAGSSADPISGPSAAPVPAPVSGPSGTITS